jgi:hypothetical protein
VDHSAIINARWYNLCTINAARLDVIYETTKHVYVRHGGIRSALLIDVRVERMVNRCTVATRLFERGIGAKGE